MMGVIDNPAVEYRDEHLYLVARDRIYRIAAWPSLRTETQNRHGAWHIVPPDIRDIVLEETGSWPVFEVPQFNFDGDAALVERSNGQRCFHWAADRSELRALRVRTAIEQFEATVPPELWSRLPWIGIDPISALEWAREVPDSLDLAVNDPWLAAALARHWEFPAVGRIDWDMVRRIARKRRRDIVGWLGFPAKEAVANALRRLRPASGNSSEMVADVRIILEGVSNSRLGPTLMRLPEFTRPVLQVLADRDIRDRISADQLHEFGHLRLADQWNAWSDLEERAELVRFGVVESTFLLTWRPRTSRHDRLAYSSIPLRDAPLPAGPQPASGPVRQIRSVHELIREGAAMQHCAGSTSCILDALRGSIAFYHIEAPVSATLALRECGDRWRLAELRRARNAEVCADHRAAILGNFTSVTDE